MQPIRSTQSLSGKWDFALDPDHRGHREQWFCHPEKFVDSVQVPGAFQAQGLGDNRYCTPLCQTRGIPPMIVEKCSYFGTAWYRRTFAIPDAWRGKNLWLVFGGTHPVAEVWIDDRFVATHRGSFLEHAHDIGAYVSPGQRHTLTVCIREFDAALAAGQRGWEAEEGGTFNLTTWSGIWRDVFLEARDSCWIDEIRITPEVAAGYARLDLRIAGEPPAGLGLRVEICDATGKPAADAEVAAAPQARLRIAIPNARLWSPEAPHLYTARIRLISREGAMIDQTTERFGMRELAVDGQQILLNGQPVFLRGYGDDQLYVHTLAPTLDRGELDHELRQAKRYGFNFVNFLFSVPHKEYLDAADEIGILIQCYPTQLWHAEHNVADTADYVARIVRQLYNHPSVALYSVAAEKYGFDPARTIEQLRCLVAEADATRLWITTGGITRAEAVRDCTDILEMARDFCTIPETLNVCRKPVVLHEYHWWSSYPDSRIKAQYNQSAVRPYYIDYAEAIAHEKGMSDQLPVFVANSQKLQAMERKLGLERARRNPGVKGYALWMGKDMKDAVEGLWDDFGQPKNVAAETFCQSNGETVLLIGHDALFRCYWCFEDIPIEMWLSHYGAQPIRDATLAWTLATADDGTILAEGRRAGLGCPAGVNARLVEFGIRPRSVDRPVHAVLRARLQAEALEVANQWDYWLFPSLEGQAVETKRDLEGNLCLNGGGTAVRTFSQINDALFDCLEQGGRILLLATGIFPERSAAFKSIYWNSGIEGQSGTVIAPHPALGDFPHEGFCDWQFFAMLRNVQPVDLDAWPVRIDPIIRAIASYKTCYNMGHLFEVKAGNGRLLITTLDLMDRWQAYPTSSVEKDYLLNQLKRYITSDRFEPNTTVPLSFLEQFQHRTD